MADTTTVNYSFTPKRGNRFRRQRRKHGRDKRCIKRPFHRKRNG